MYICTLQKPMMMTNRKTKYKLNKKFVINYLL